MKAGARAADAALRSLLLDCVRDDLGRIPAAIAACPAEALAALPPLAVYHGVVTAVRRALSAVELPEPSVREHLDRLAVEQKATTLRLRAELGRLGSSLNDTGIRWAVLKGPVLADVYYPRTGRSFADLDVLVDPTQLGTVIEVLSPAAALLDRNWALIRRSRRGELTFALPAGGTLDLHWHILNEAAIRRSFRISTTELLDRVRTVTTGAGEAPTLDPVDTLLHVAAHACLSGGARLAWYVDVKAVASSAELDWTEVVRRGRQTGLGLPVGIVLERTRSLLDLELPPGVLGELGGTTGWAYGMRAVARVRPLPAVRRRVLSSHTLTASTRDRSLSSTTALVTAVGTHLARRVRRSPESSTNPLHTDGGGPHDRDAFLSAVAEEEHQAYAASSSA